MPRLSHIPALIIATLMLGSCGKTGDQPAGKTTTAQVLPGSVSDAMLITDGSTAQAPLLPPKPVHAASADDTGDDASDSAEPDQAAPAAEKTVNAPAAN